jgi:membrane protease YdiL (CAAX protease family)
MDPFEHLENKKSIIKHQQRLPWQFLMIVLVLTWFFWMLASQESLFIVVFHYFGGAIPLLTTLFFLFIYHSPTDRYDFLVRVVDIRRISIKFLMIIVLVVPVGFLLVAGMDWGLNGNLPRIEHWQNFQNQTGEFLLFAIFILIFGPIPEELAWRGYILDLLQKKYPWLIANLILGFFWMVWHLPLFWIPGSYQNSLGILTPGFWFFFAVLIPQTIIIGWIYNSTHRSTLAAILVHFMINFMGELVDFALSGEILLVLYWWLLALLVIVLHINKERAHIRAKNSSINH